jgi:hypothetical protein
MQGSVRKEVHSAYILGSLFSTLVMPAQILKYYFSATFPHNTRQKRGVYPIVGRAFLFPAESAHILLPAIVLQFSVSRDHL